MTKNDRRTIDKVFVSLGVVATIILLIVSMMCFYGYKFADKNVKDQLSAQQVFFPSTDSPAFKALPASDQKEMAKYAGQQLTNGRQAQVYANNFINVHLSEIAGGKTYSQVSALALADPTNTTLKTQQQLLFQGETLRGLLLGDGYGFWMFGQIAYYAYLASLLGALVMLLLVVLGLERVYKS
mgnify:CR=1 FL=1